MSNRCDTYTLAQATDLFMMRKGVDKKKYFSRYLVFARYVWKDIFKNTLWQTQSVWKTVQQGDPHPYIDVPPESERIFSVSVEDDCGKVTPLFYNSRINVVKKPAKKKCGCTACDCGGLCSDVNGLTVTTKLLFSINGVDYYEKTYIESCKNGDMLLWTETPTKKYNDLAGDAGDFNDDYNNDYSIAAAPFSDYTIVTVKSQKKLCKLETLPCGCPVQTPENEEVFNQFCGCFLAPCNRKKKCCDDFLANPNNNRRGEVKLSECGTKIFFVPSPHWKGVTRQRIPDFLLINFQTNGETISQEVLVPEYSLECMFSGMQYFSRKQRDNVSYNEKLGDKWAYEDERSRLILYLSPLDLEELSHIQESPIKW